MQVISSNIRTEENNITEKINSINEKTEEITELENDLKEKNKSLIILKRNITELDNKPSKLGIRIEEKGKDIARFKEIINVLANKIATGGNSTNNSDFNMIKNRINIDISNKERASNIAREKKTKLDSEIKNLTTTLTRAREAKANQNIEQKISDIDTQIHQLSTEYQNLLIQLHRDDQSELNQLEGSRKQIENAIGNSWIFRNVLKDNDTLIKNLRTPHHFYGRIFQLFSIKQQ
mmetsp:Transcript_53630/g.45031  ORF Transcript_53630/g.45031 Transcript_53630/m.45031 type:complete len:235 (+) Transcript_53630:871-1575(+)